MKLRNLETVRYIIKKATGLDLNYAYDDLAFPEHMAFLIQFNDSDNKSLFCYFHNDCNPKDQKQLFKDLKKAATEEKITLEKRGSFALEQKGKEVEIRFSVQKS